MGVSREGGEAGRPTTANVIDRLSRFDGPPEQFLAYLLAVQCQVGRAEAGAILRAMPEGKGQVLAVYPPLPQGATAPVWLAVAFEAFAEAMGAGATLFKPVHARDDLYGQPARRNLILVPLRGVENIRGVAAFFVEARDAAVLEAARERLELTVSLLSLYEMRLLLQRRQTDLRRLRAAMETLAAVNEQDRFAGLAMSLCNEVASRWQCDRVGIGILKGRYVRVRAMSHTEKFNRRMRLVQDLEAAMEECLDQDIEVPYPASPEATCVSRAAGELSRRHGPSSILSLPLRRGGKATAVLMLERPADRPFTVEEAEALRLTADLCTARLVNLEEHDRWIGARAAAGIRKGAATVVGPKHTWIKLAVIALFLFFAFTIIFKGDYRADVPFVLEPVEQQVVPAPFDGYLQTVLVEPGDPVEAGRTVMATLETADLRLQLAVAKADWATFSTQAAAARRDAKTAEARIAEAQADKAKAQIDLWEYQIGRATLVAPITGKVTAGDLKRRIGAPVKTGDALFEVAPLKALRAELSVPEDDVPDMEEGQVGELATASYPEQRIKFVVERINPVSELAEQRNVFKVRVRLESRPLWMRSGMEGVAKVTMGKQRYLWIWTRPLVNWVRMKLWL